MRSRLPADEAAAIHHLYNTTPVVYMCRRMLVSSLLSGGIQCEQDGRPASEAFQAVLQRHWIPFVRDLIDAYFMFGFCPVRVVKTAKPARRGEKACLIPIVPPFGVYDAEVRVDPSDYHQTLHFLPKRGATVEGGEDANVHMLVSDDGMPNVVCTTHRSRVSTLVAQFRWMERMKTYALQAEHIRSHPPLITQDSPDKRPINETVASEAFADPVELFAEHEERRYRKNASNMNALRQQRSMVADLNRTRRAEDQVHVVGFGEGAGSVTLAQTYEDNTYHVPDGTQVAAQAPMPQARADLTDLERMRVDVVCATFGVPKSLIMTESGRPNASGANEMDYRMLRRTMESLAACISRALTATYALVYGGDDLAELTLPFIPLTTSESVQLVYDAGVISKETQGKYLMLTCGLPLLDLDLGAQSRESSPRGSKRARPPVDDDSQS